MLENILLLSWDRELYDKTLTEDQIKDFIATQAYMAYPNEKAFLEKPEIITNIFSAHNEILSNNLPLERFTDDFIFNNCTAVRVNGYNLLSLPLPHQQVLGLIFDLESNPYDYRNELVKLFNEYVMEKFLSNRNNEYANNLLLLTLFIDLRKYGNELAIYNEPQNKVQTINGIPMIKVFVYGLDFAGKSSLMRLLATGRFDHDYFVPTTKFRITLVELNKSKLVFWDMPGQQVFRRDWLRGAQASNILLFILDSADTKRFDEAKIEFWRMVNLYELQNLPIIFLVNKTDLLAIIPTDEDIKKTFNLDKLDQECIIIYSSLPVGQGIDDLLNWFEEKVQELLINNDLVVE